MHKMLLASAACLALLTATAYAQNDRAHGHGKGREAPAASVAPSHTPRTGDNGRRGSFNASAPDGHAVRGSGRNLSGRNVERMDNGQHGWRINDERHGRTWKASESGQDNNAGQRDNAMRGHGPRGNGPANNAWQGNNRNNAWQGGNARWHGPQNWRGDRTYWARYHRSWHANRRYHWNGAYVRPAGFTYRHWTLGVFLPAIFFAQQYWIPDYAVFALDPPPPGTVWVRYGNDALLVDRYSGEVIQVVYGIFY